MDFKSLPRKDLQTLCKKNMIPANITNVAMAEALAALQEVAGIEEFLNPIESESKQSEERIDNGSPGNCRTACRTSTRRKVVKEEPTTTQSIVRTRRGRVGEMADQENKDLNILLTPSFPSNRRRAPVPSARKKLETHSIEGKEEDKDQNNGNQKRSDVLETPSMPKTQRKVSVLGSTRRKTEVRMDKSSVQGACSTRHSMRLLEKNMEKLGLMESPEKKEFCKQIIEIAVAGNSFEEDDSKVALRLGIDESDDPEGVNETKDDEDQANDAQICKETKEKVQSEAAIKDQCESEDKIQSEAAIEEQKENSEIITEKTVEFIIEDLVDINVEVEFQYVNAHDSILESKMEVQVLSDGESSFKKMVDFDNGDLIDVDVIESELVENCILGTCNVEEQVNYFDSKDSLPEPKIEDLRESDEILAVHQELPHEENSVVIDNSSFTPFAVDQIPGQFPRPTDEVSVKESRTSLEIFNFAFQDEHIKNNSNDDEERNFSLRQLRKMIKELHLSKKSNKEQTCGKEKVEKVVRTALQPLSENCLAKEGQEKTTANSMFIQ